MLPLPDLVTTRDTIAQLTDRLSEVYDERAHGDIADPGMLCRALTDVLNAVHQRTHVSGERELANDPSAENLAEPPLGELCDHGIDLLTSLAETAQRLSMTDEARQIQALTLPLACCVGRVGGEIGHLAPVVNAAAEVANGMQDRSGLARLYGMLDEIANAVSLRIAESAPGSEDAQAWRALLINRAIVATRSHEPSLMQAAFDALIEHRPEDAPGFFNEGMGQMDALDYPAEVRLVMERYQRRFRNNRTLH
jgi:hypothetical protein